MIDTITGVVGPYDRIRQARKLFLKSKIGSHLFNTGLHRVWFVFILLSKELYGIGCSEHDRQEFFGHTAI